MRAKIHTFLKPAQPWQALGRLLLLPAIAAFIGGCASPRSALAWRTTAHQPDNIYRSSQILPLGLKRVLVLPLTRDPARPDLAYGTGILEPLLEQELIRTERFEVVHLAPGSLFAHTGRTMWNAEDILPADFLTWLREASACDAVLFCRLMTFRGYAPLAVGWRIRLVEVKTGATLWAVEEVFDAGQPAIQAAARDFLQENRKTSDASDNEWVMTNSPRLFGRYTLDQLLSTLPAR